MNQNCFMGVTMKEFLQSHGIKYCAAVELERCKVIKEYLLTKNGFDRNAYAVTMLIPYRTEVVPTNISVYASVCDYHAFINQLSLELDAYVKEKYPLGRFKLFADHSPIDEVHATCISGLGFIGDNGLLINEEYSSFVFLAECITDLAPEEIGMELAPPTEVKECIHCGACALACPAGCIKKAGGVDDFKPKSACLSAITQKKGELDDGEIKMMLDNNTVWGCDVCQNACPYTKKAKFSDIAFFKKGAIRTLTYEDVEKMSDEEFLSRPFSWRGRQTILRNLKLYEERR